MNDNDDAQLDAALEAIARQEPPADHVANVLARSGPQAGYGLQAAGYLQPRWALPVAATVLVALGTFWQVSRQTSGLEAVIESAESQSAALASGWGIPEAIDRPVLPPPAYWGMDAFDEWNSLRPGSGLRGLGTENTTRARHRGQQAGPAPLAWVPVPSGLPPIELESITPAPIEIAPLAALEEIIVAEIALAPIVIAPVNEEEKP